MSEIDLDQLRQLVENAKQTEKENNQGTVLLEKINDNRKRLKKINPKFCEPWSSLDLDLKINRLIEHVSRLQEKQDLSNSTAKKIRQLLVNALVNETLDVDYDNVVGVVNKIPKLHYNDEQGWYLGTYLNDEGQFIFRVSKISSCVDKNDNSKLSITTEKYLENTATKKKKLSLSIKKDIP